jgi:hypothetical protein
VKTYPTIAFLVRYQRILSIVAALVFPAAGICGGFFTDMPWLPVVGGLILGPVTYLIAKSFLELVELIDDTLVPK